ncbi:hypothetical protein IWQ56_003118, partial [Coemansia nantahalensis]
MDDISDDEGFFLIPAALQSGQTTPTRASLLSERRASAQRMSGSGYGPVGWIDAEFLEDAEHFQEHPLGRADASGCWEPVCDPRTGLCEFPRPRLSTEDPPDVVPADNRAERRLRNQYKRHG